MIQPGFLFLPSKVGFREEEIENLDSITLDKLAHTYDLSTEIIKELSPLAINELYGGDERDQENIFESILDETYRILYGSRKLKQIQSSAFGYLDKLTDSMEETLRCENLLYFINSVLPNFELNWHHLEWVDTIMKFPFFDILASRGHGKSFLFSNALPAWRCYRYKRNANDKYKGFLSREHKHGYLFSFSVTQAIELLSILKDTIDNNDILRERLFPDNLQDGWNKSDITCRNGSRVTVKGFGSSVRGAHPGWIMIDDPHKDNIIYSEEQRNKAVSYFHSVIEPMPPADGSIGIVGTPFHSLDLHGELKTKKKFVCLEYPCIYPNGKILWKNKFPLKTLLELKESQGSLVFSREYLCKPVVSDATIFPIEILNNAFVRMEDFVLVNSRENYKKNFDKVITGCDFAISANVAADYSVFTTWGIDEKEIMWLLHCWRVKGKSFGEQMAMLKYIYVNFKPDWMVLEKNQFQQIFVSEAEKAGLPIIPHQTTANKNDFKMGLPSLSLKFERGKIKIPIGDKHSKDIADMFVTEFNSIAFTEKGLQSVDGHDDIPMSTWIASEGVRQSGIGQFGFTFI